jgi:hypothetical protein
MTRSAALRHTSFFLFVAWIYVGHAVAQVSPCGSGQQLSSSTPVLSGTSTYWSPTYISSNNLSVNLNGNTVTGSADMTLQAGTAICFGPGFRVAGSSGRFVALIGIGSFQTTVAVGSPIQITSQFSGGSSVDLRSPFAINWTGGDSSEVVTVTLVKKSGFLQDQYVYTTVPAVDHGVVWQPETICCMTGPNGNPVSTVKTPFAFPGHELQVIVDVAPAAGAESFSAPGLTLGGTQTWGYQYRFTGLKEKGN